MINPNIKKQYPVIKMPNGHPISATMYNRNTSQGVVYTNNEEIINTDLSANLSTTSTVVANINITHSIRSDLSATSELANATITKVISLQSSISTNNTVSANTLVSKLLASSVTSTGILAAELTVMSGSAFDAHAQAFFDRVTTAGGTLSATEQTAVNTLVIALKADGIWTKMKAIYPMVGASAAACAQNLVSSSFTGTFSSGWTFASTGATPNGTSAFLNTNLNVNASLLLNSVSHCFYNRKTTQTGLSGANDANNYFLIGGSSNTIFYSTLNTAASPDLTATVTNMQGFFIANRTSSTDVSLFRNSIKLISATRSVLNKPNRTYYIGSRNNDGVAGSFDTKEFALFTIGDGLTDTEAANFYTDVQAFQTSLNRQVN